VVQYTLPPYVANGVHHGIVLFCLLWFIAFGGNYLFKLCQASPARCGTRVGTSLHQLNGIAFVDDTFSLHQPNKHPCATCKK
jgi:hypothetical protein